MATHCVSCGRHCDCPPIPAADATWSPLLAVNRAATGLLGDYAVEVDAWRVAVGPDSGGSPAADRAAAS